MRCKAAIVGIPGPTPDDQSAALLREGRPAGVILFGRNVQDRVQLCALTSALRDVLPPEAVLMIDQEGGRVARLRPPHWRAHPAAGVVGALYARDPESGLRTAWLTGALIGMDCADMGLDVVCAPVLDRRLPDYADVIGDRGFAGDPEAVAKLGRSVADGLLAAGIQPVIKHLPGHGRARVDSHFSLPTISDNTADDLAPFIANADLPWAMTAHIVYPVWDTSLPATLSPTVITKIIRGTIGFQGILVSDDLAMHALAGTPAERVVASLAAGCDIALYCPGDPEGTRAALAACAPLSDRAVEHLAAARKMAQQHLKTLDAEDLAAERDALLR
jgi:beta-N-acetylhexosaminidase